MGDNSRRGVADKFIEAFEKELLATRRSALLDNAFGSAVRYYVGVDDVDWTIGVVAVVTVGDATEAFALLESSNLFPVEGPIAWIDCIAGLLDISPHEAERRLVQAGLLQEM